MNKYHQFSSAAHLCLTLWDPMDYSVPGLPVYHQLPKFTQTHVHQVGDAIQPSHPLSSPSPPAFNLSQHQGLFQWVSSAHQMAKVLGVSVSTSVLPMNIQDWFPFRWTGWISLQSKGLSRVFSNTTVQKHHLQRSAFFIVHHHTRLLEKTIALTRRTFVGKVMSLLFNMLSRLVITFLSRSMRLLISWLQSLSRAILEPKKIRPLIVSPSICHEVMGPDAMILVSEC